MKKYIPRILEKELLTSIKEFPVMVLTGPRQTGKSTLLQKIFPDHFYVTLDDPLIRELAKNDPQLFLTKSQKILIDEIQFLPELLPYIKISVDQNRENNGRYILTGSQIFPLMAGVSESLAGRAVIYELLGFSSEETNWLNFREPKSCFDATFKGFFPEVIVHGVSRDRFYSAYVQTYLERDIRQLTSVQDLKVFQNFIELIAARVGSVLNLNEISKECGISFTSARRWLSILETTRMIYLLRPYTRNISKRVIKSPKIYFSDTGLLSYLWRYPDAQTVQAGPQAGALFENLVVMELLKYKMNHHLNYELYFYRDSNQNEIDVIIDMGSNYKLLEIKSTSTPRMEHLSGLKKIMPLFNQADGYLLTLATNANKLSNQIEILSWQDILSKL